MADIHRAISASLGVREGDETGAPERADHLMRRRLQDRVVGRRYQHTEDSLAIWDWTQRRAGENSGKLLNCNSLYQA